MLFSFRCINSKGSPLDLPAHSMNENKNSRATRNGAFNRCCTRIHAAISWRKMRHGHKNWRSAGRKQLGVRSFEAEIAASRHKAEGKKKRHMREKFRVGLRSASTAGCFLLKPNHRSRKAHPSFASKYRSWFPPAGFMVAKSVFKLLKACCTASAMSRCRSTAPSSRVSLRARDRSCMT